MPPRPRDQMRPIGSAATQSQMVAFAAIRPSSAALPNPRLVSTPGGRWRTVGRAEDAVNAL
jgi:hypothetical protein